VREGASLARRSGPAVLRCSCNGSPRGRHQRGQPVHDRTKARHICQRREDRGRGHDHRRWCTGHGRPGRSGSGGALPDAGAIGSGCAPGSRPTRAVCGRTHGCAPTRRPANSPRDRKPRIRLRQIWVGSTRHPQGSLASGPGPVSIGRLGRRDARRSRAAARSGPCAPAAAWIHLAKRTGVQRPPAGTQGVGRTATATRVLPVKRATAAWVRRSRRASPWRATDRRPGSADALIPRAGLDRNMLGNSAVVLDHDKGRALYGEALDEDVR
jgi:hypothetical protein